MYLRSFTFNIFFSRTSKRHWKSIPIIATQWLPFWTLSSFLQLFTWAVACHVICYLERCDEKSVIFGTHISPQVLCVQWHLVFPVWVTHAESNGRDVHLHGKRNIKLTLITEANHSAQSSHVWVLSIEGKENS